MTAKDNKTEREAAAEDATDKNATGRRKKILLTTAFWVTSGVLVVSGASLAVYGYFLQQNEFSFFPGVTLAGHDVAGKTYMEALDELQAQVDQLNEVGVTVQYPRAVTAADNELAPPTLQLTPTIVPLSAAGNEREIYSVDLGGSLDNAYEIGRTGDVLLQAKQQFWAAWYGRPIQLDYTFDEEYIRELLEETFSKYESPAQNADIEIGEDGEIDIVPEELGERFDYDAVLAAIESNIQNFSTEPVELSLETDFPEVIVDDVQDDLALVESYLERAPVTLTWEEDSWVFDRAAVGSWLTYRSDEKTAATGELTINMIRFEESLEDALELINIHVKEARWKVEKDTGGNLIGLTEFEEAQDGRDVKLKRTANAVLAYLAGDDSKFGDVCSIEQPYCGEPGESVEIVVEITKPKFTPETVEGLGITDILGTGHSYAGGSPYNRRLNIARGAELLNGLLIAPDEEFSLLDALKPFTIENGYYAELVIKGNETVPEVGGGLCQIGTTTFRAVMATGLDVTSRQNHSYVVSYYADDKNGLPGTDATIYDPAPDFKFINDTPGYILLQTRVDGSHLYFDFWGTDDGRTADWSAPTISGWVSPPPTKEIPSPDLAPGQRNCTESAHAGTTAYTTYRIEYADGSVHEEEFVSKYKPWQAVCLVGQEEAAAEEAGAADEAAEETPQDNTADPPAETSQKETANENKKASG
ncbi:VanW family protein [Patescibacteria group bacterium]